jgi:haloacid dehalogenase-like hydrolase
MSPSSVNRRVLISILTSLPALSSPLLTIPASAQTTPSTNPLPSWNDGAAKRAILDFVRTTTDTASPDHVPAEDRLPSSIRTARSGSSIRCTRKCSTASNVSRRWSKKNRSSRTSRLSRQCSRATARRSPGFPCETSRNPGGNAYRHVGGGVHRRSEEWIETARHPRWKRPYTELVYQPMLEVLQFLRDHGFKTYIVTGGGQDFVRVYAGQVHGIPPDQVVGTAGSTKYGYGKDGKPFLTKEPQLILNDNNAGKPEGIHLMIGRRPYAAFGNSTGDREMLEWTGAGSGARLKMLVLHDDAVREYAYGPAQDLPDSKVGTFTPALYDEARKDGWTVISMKSDWKRVFPFEQ